MADVISYVLADEDSDMSSFEESDESESVVSESKDNSSVATSAESELELSGNQQEPEYQAPRRGRLRTRGGVKRTIRT